MERTLFDDEHEQFRDSFSRWLAKEIVPNHEKWNADGIVPREVFASAGAQGYIGMDIPTEYGGGGVADFRYHQIIDEEIQAAGVGASGLGLTLHNDICVPYFLSYCTDEQKQRWLPGIASGELITAIGMTEPSIGSDLASMATTALRDGDEFVVNGQKTFITNGQTADLIIVVARTGGPGAKGLSLIVVETERNDGFRRGRNLDKIGLHASDTSELFFEDAVAPPENLLGGEEGRGFAQLMQHLPQERLIIAICAVAAMERAIKLTVDYTKERKAFGQPIIDFQNTAFKLAERKTEAMIARVFVDWCVGRLVAGDLDAVTASMAKWWCTQKQVETVDECLQLHGGYGYMQEYPISRMFVDARVQKIYGGANEVMKLLIARSL